MRRLTTFGLILRSVTVNMEITHLIRFSTRIFRRFRGFSKGIIDYWRVEHEKMFIPVPCRWFLSSNLGQLRRLPSETRHSGDSTILSIAIPPYAKSLIAAMIRICRRERIHQSVWLFYISATNIWNYTTKEVKINQITYFQDAGYRFCNKLNNKGHVKSIF